LNRAEKFKIIRNRRRNMILTITLFVLITVSGIMLVDYSFNNIMKIEKTIFPIIKFITR